MKTTRILAVVFLGAGLSMALAVRCGETARPPEAGAGVDIALPPPRPTGPIAVEQALARRRSIRQFAARDLTLEHVGQLLWAAQGVTEPSRGLRTAPSAGALYPLEVYAVKRDGVFRYVAQGHKLVRLSKRDARAALANAALGQSAVRDAPLDIVIAAIYERTRVKYGARAERYVHIEVGHVGQNIHLQAVALGLGSVSIGAFDDGAVARVLGLPAAEQPLYIIPVGSRRSGSQ